VTPGVALRPRTQGAHAQGLGRSRGGLSTKIHAAGDALGNPVRLIGSPGQRNDIVIANPKQVRIIAHAKIKTDTIVRQRPRAALCKRLSAGSLDS
jgi:hypothetical protein